MKSLLFRICLTVALCVAIAGSGLWSPLKTTAAPAATAAEGKSLTIGSVAPPLDIEHWIQDGNGFFQPVQKFEAGKVYVVEFWATWCGPCISSMPHLADLQNQFRGRGVQVISVSDEDLDTVTKFLDREGQNAAGEPATFREITSAYSLTTDPDQSVYEDYMTASAQQGIPTAFIVGKDGMIEWIGHPMEMDSPLEAVVDGSWDRAGFAKLYNAEREFNETFQQIAALAGRGKMDEALELIDAELKRDLPAEIQERWSMMKQQVKLSAGMIDDEVKEFFAKQLEASKGDARRVWQISWGLYQASREQTGLEELLKSSITALTAELEAVDESALPTLHDTLAHLNEAVGDLASAVASQEKAVEAATGRTKERLQTYLDELKAKLEAK